MPRHPKNSGAATVPECNGLSQFKEDTGGPSTGVGPEMAELLHLYLVILERELQLAVKEFLNRSGIDKVTAMVRVAPFLTHGVD